MTLGSSVSGDIRLPVELWSEIFLYAIPTPLSSTPNDGLIYNTRLLVHNCDDTRVGDHDMRLALRLVCRAWNEIVQNLPRHPHPTCWHGYEVPYSVTSFSTPILYIHKKSDWSLCHCSVSDDPPTAEPGRGECAVNALVEVDEVYDQITKIAEKFPDLQILSLYGRGVGIRYDIFDNFRNKAFLGFLSNLTHLRLPPLWMRRERYRLINDYDRPLELNRLHTLSIHFSTLDPLLDAASGDWGFKELQHHFCFCSWVIPNLTYLEISVMIRLLGRTQEYINNRTEELLNKFGSTLRGFAYHIKQLPDPKKLNDQLPREIPLYCRNLTTLHSHLSRIALVARWYFKESQPHVSIIISDFNNPTWKWRDWWIDNEDLHTHRMLHFLKWPNVTFGMDIYWETLHKQVTRRRSFYEQFMEWLEVLFKFFDNLKKAGIGFKDRSGRGMESDAATLVLNWLYHVKESKWRDFEKEDWSDDELMEVAFPRASNSSSASSDNRLPVELWSEIFLYAIPTPLSSTPNDGLIYNTRLLVHNCYDNRVGDPDIRLTLRLVCRAWNEIVQNLPYHPHPTCWHGYEVPYSATSFSTPILYIHKKSDWSLCHCSVSDDPPTAEPGRGECTVKALVEVDEVYDGITKIAEKFPDLQILSLYGRGLTIRHSILGDFPNNTLLDFLGNLTHLRLPPLWMRWEGHRLINDYDRPLELSRLHTFSIHFSTPDPDPLLSDTSDVWRLRNRHFCFCSWVIPNLRYLEISVTIRLLGRAQEYINDKVDELLNKFGSTLQGFAYHIKQLPDPKNIDDQLPRRIPLYFQNLTTLHSHLSRIARAAQWYFNESQPHINIIISDFNNPTWEWRRWWIDNKDLHTRDLVYSLNRRNVTFGMDIYWETLYEQVTSRRFPYGEFDEWHEVLFNFLTSLKRAEIGFRDRSGRGMESEAVEPVINRFYDIKNSVWRHPEDPEWEDCWDDDIMITEDAYQTLDGN
ncbi:hypothetical protein CPB86DRAFT_816925 [Serendipita vermifera]|nr:hypothetical protein CPB86DRAFT_816925 [Serendipita vermifera]